MSDAVLAWFRSLSKETQEALLAAQRDYKK